MSYVGIKTTIERQIHHAPNGNYYQRTCVMAYGLRPTKGWQKLRTQRAGWKMIRAPKGVYVPRNSTRIEIRTSWDRIQ